MSKSDIFTNTTLPGSYMVTGRSFSRPSGFYGDFSRPESNRALTNFENRSGSVTADFHRLSQTGRLPFNEFFYRKIETIWDNGYQYEKYGNDYSWSENTRSGYTGGNIAGLDDIYSFPTLLMDNLENQAIQQVLAKLKDQDINLALAWQERDLTLKMILTAFKRLGQSYSALKRGNFSAAAAALGVGGNSSSFRRSFARNQSKAVARGWLELQYGWRPLLSDIYGSTIFLEKSLNDSRKQYVSKTQSKSLEHFDTKQTADSGTVTWSKWESKVTKKVMVKYRLVSPTLATLSGLGFTNPAVLAWEAVPFSFVIDWALPIGNWLSSLDSSLGWRLDDAAVTTFTTNAFERTVVANSKPGYIEFRSNISTSKKEITCRRHRITSIDLLTLPSFKDPESLTHLANAIALLSTHKR